MLHAMLQTHFLAPLAGEEEARMAKRKVDARIVSFMVVDEVKVIRLDIQAKLELV